MRYKSYKFLLFKELDSINFAVEFIGRLEKI